MKRERWKELEGFPGYRISDRGRVRRKFKSRRGFKDLQPWENATGWVVNLYTKEKKRYTRRVGDLVARNFLLPYDGKDLEFIDGDIRNCVLSNLAWKDRGDLGPSQKLPDHLINYIYTIRETPLGDVIGIQTQLAEKYNVSIGQISRIWNKKRNKKVIK
jgi:hypothetical protein